METIGWQILLIGAAGGFIGLCVLAAITRKEGMNRGRRVIFRK